MARRLNTRQSESARSAIQTTKLLKRLEDHVLARGKKAVTLTSTQVRAAEVVLRKALPDLQSVELGGAIETKHHVTHDELVGLLLRGPVPTASGK